MYKKLALITQLNGENAVDDELMQRLFTREQRELLIHSSFLSKIGTKWSFDIAFFQENIAALALLQMPLGSVYDMVTVGVARRRIKTKWIQTIASYISLLEEGDSRKESVLELVRNDNIELITFCDASKLSFDFRLQTVKEVFQKCIRLSSFPRVTRVDVIAAFIKNEAEGIKYLLSIVQSSNTSQVKALSWRVIEHFDDLGSLRNDVKQEILNTIKNIEDGGFARILVDILTKFNLVLDEDICCLLRPSKLLQEPEYLNGLFDLLISKNLVDKYYYVGLEAVDVFENHDKVQRQYKAQAKLEYFLMLPNDPNNVIAFLKLVHSKKWGPIYRDTYLNDDKQVLLKEMCELAIRIHPQNALVFFPVADILRYQISRPHNKEYIHLYEFFRKTDTVPLFFKLSLKIVDKIDLPYLALLVTKECCDFIFDNLEIEDEENVVEDKRLLPQSQIVQMYSWIRYWKEDDNLANLFHERLLHTTGIDYNKLQEERNGEHFLLEAKKHENDLKHILSPDAFIAGLTAFFQAYGSNSIPSDKVFVGVSPNIVRRLADSTFISNFLLRFEYDKKEISLSDCLNVVEKDGWFECFRAKQIYRYHFPTEESIAILSPFLKNYYSQEIQVTNFVNAIRQNGNTYSMDKKANFLKEIFVKFKYETAQENLLKMLWVIWDGFHHLKRNNYGTNQNTTLSELIIENVVSKEQLIETIISNLKSDIQADRVIASHLELCRHLEINEVTEFILDERIFSRFADYEQTHIVEIFTQLGGDEQKLLELFRKLGTVGEKNVVLYLDLSKRLLQKNKIEIVNSLLGTLSNLALDDSRRLEVSIRLISAGQEVGFAFFVDGIVQGKIWLEHFHRSLSLLNIPAKLVLKEMQRIIHHILDKSEPIESRDYSIKDFIWDCLFKVSKRNEEDLLDVESFLYTAYDGLKDSHSNAHEILFCIDRVLENYRDLDGNVYQPTDISRILATVDWAN
ncbi:hypothetical protein GCM10023093_07190 [Nemorincola caseinilytica]|uniref:Uncharacterized protein n=1 Tax=Nemorincola caseinilytica TaxID=2054315 RepID=A0ABP8N5R4_9BACT